MISPGLSRIDCERWHFIYLRRFNFEASDMPGGTPHHLEARARASHNASGPRPMMTWGGIDRGMASSIKAIRGAHNHSQIVELSNQISPTSTTLASKPHV